MERLTNIVLETMEGYAGRGLNAYSYLTRDDVNQLYTVITIASNEDRRFSQISLLVRIMGNIIIIEEDINNKPLVDALVQNGIDRKQIVLAYAGEAIPTVN